MPGKALSLGFIGGGWNSAVGTTHFIAARMDGLFSIDAGAFSRDAGTNAQTAENWGIAKDRLYADGSALLTAEQGRLDAVVVLTPTPDHADLVLRAIELGYPVICEKALAASTGDARRIVAASSTGNAFLAVTYNYTGYPMLRELRRLLRDGHIGEITQVHAEMPQEGFARLGRDGKPVLPQPWRLHDGAIPTISLDLGVHLHHLVDFLTDAQPREVLAMHGSHGHFRDVVDNVTCLARYDNGMDCTYWYSKSAIGHRNGLRLRIYGTRGSVEWFQMEPEQLLLHDARGQRTILDRACVDATLAAEARYNRFKAGHPAGFMEAFANLYVDIAEALAARREGRPVSSKFVFTGRHALDGLLMLEAMAISARDRSWTPVTAG